MNRFAFLLLALLATPSAAQNQTEEVQNRVECVAEALECFQMFNHCEQMEVSVLLDQNDIGLTRERIATAVQRRLRAARLYDESAPYALVVSVGVLDDSPAFRVEFEYYKTLLDEDTGNSFFTTTWSRGGYGTHAGNAGIVLQAISERMDQFINEYLRVNAPACDQVPVGQDL